MVKEGLVFLDLLRIFFREDLDKALESDEEECRNIKLERFGRHHKLIVEVVKGRKGITSR